jgi:hypothetical protein
VGGWIIDTLAMYGRVGRRAAELLVRNGSLVVPSILLLEVLFLGRALLAPLGILGAFAYVIVQYAALSAVLTFTSEAIRSGRVRAGEVGTAFSTYLSDLISVGFVVFGLQLIASLLFQGVPPLYFFVMVVLLVFFNAAPELVTIGRLSATEVLGASWQFIGVYWVEWFPPNLLLLMAVLGAALIAPGGPLGPLAAVVASPALAFLMLVRALLFQELTTSSRRGRAFRREASS